MGSHSASGPRAEFWSAVEDLKNAVHRSKAVDVNSQKLRQAAYDLAQEWFRDARPAFTATGVSDPDLSEIDAGLQQLLRLSVGRNKKSAYTRLLNTIRRSRGELETAATRGFAAPIARDSNVATALEISIVRTLERMNPAAANSYQQVIDDLATTRRSYRGTATELREVVREVLDQLAPDEEVEAAPGYKHEKDRTRPTMKQKARYILKARGLGESARSAPEKAVELLEEQIASIVRGVYDRGSASTHTATTRPEVLLFKGYADAVLAELLQVHKP